MPADIPVASRKLFGQPPGNACQLLEGSRRIRAERGNRHDAREPQSGSTGQLFGQRGDFAGGRAAAVRACVVVQADLDEAVQGRAPGAFAFDCHRLGEGDSHGLPVHGMHGMRRTSPRIWLSCFGAGR